MADSVGLATQLETYKFIKHELSDITQRIAGLRVLLADNKEFREAITLGYIESELEDIMDNL